MVDGVANAICCAGGGVGVAGAGVTATGATVLSGVARAVITFAVCGTPWLNHAGTKLPLPDKTRLCALKLLSFCMRRLIFSCAHCLISSILMAPEPSKSLASRNMQSRKNCVANPPFCSSSKLISLSRAAEICTMSWGKAPRLTCSLTKLRVLIFTGLLHSSDSAANFGRSAPSSLLLAMPRVLAVAAAATSPPEWQASYMTNNLSVFCVICANKLAISVLLIIPLLIPS